MNDVRKQCKSARKAGIFSVPVASARHDDFESAHFFPHTVRKSECGAEWDMDCVQNICGRKS
jgi:hypothetical protein